MDWLPVVTAGVVAWLAALALTPLARELAQRRGWVAPPRKDRWSQRPVALMGGTAIVAAVAVGLLPLLGRLGARELWLLGLSGALGGLGLLDDRRHLKPQTKLLGQILAAVALVAAGYRFGFSPDRWRLTTDALSVVWLIGLTNAMNLLDNMDGLCAGIAAIAAGCLAAVLGLAGDWPAAGMCLAVAGACVGYLRYNAWPASIFMGDCGSLWLGFFLGGAVLLTDGPGAGRGVVGVLALPVALLCIPLLDTTLVTIARKWARRPVSQGGKDHTSHRLVAIGLSEREAVRFLYALAFAGGLAGLAMRLFDWTLTPLLLPVLLFGIGALGWHLGGVRVYEPGETLGDLLARTPLPLLARPRHRRRLAEVLVDTAMIGAGFWAAAALRWEGALTTPHLAAALRQAAPVVVGAHLLANYLAGVYRGLWRHTGVGDLPRFLKAATLGLGLSLLGLWLTGGLIGLSRSLWVINWLVQVCFLSGTRLSLRVIRDRLAAWRSGGEQVLVVGEPPAAELGLRALLERPECRPVGVIAETPEAVGLELLGLPVLGSSATIEAVLAARPVHEVVLVDPDYPVAAWERIRLACRARRIPTSLAKWSLEATDPVRPAVATV